MSKTLEKLKKGLNGELNMSQGMEEVQEALTINQVPGRNFLHTASWEAIAWPSKRPLKVRPVIFIFFFFFFFSRRVVVFFADFFFSFFLLSFFSLFLFSLFLFLQRDGSWTP